MIRIKALNILSTFTKKEFEQFSRFISSPYFNRSKELIRFFSGIRKYYPHFNHSGLESEKIYKKLYPGKPFNEGTIRNLFSDLGNLSEKFLGYINYENSFDFGHKVIAEMNARALDREFEKNYKKYSERNENDEDSFYKLNLNKYFLYTEMSNYNQRKNNILDITSRSLSSEALLAFFIREFLLERSSWMSISDSYNVEQDYNVVEIFFTTTDVKTMINKLKQSNSPHAEDLELFFYLSEAGLNKTGNFYEDFDKAYNLFNKRINSMSHSSQRRMYKWIRNVINLNIKPDDKKLRKIIFELGKEMVAKELIYDSAGIINAGTFVNILLTAIVAGEIMWAKDFLENKISKLEKDSRDDIYNYYKAKILSCEKKFAESNEQLLAISKEDILFKADSKVLRMINYYELNYFEAAFSQAEAFRQFLSRNDTISAGRKEKSLNFLKFYLCLLKNKTGKDVNLSFAKKELAECTVLRNKDWLMYKFEELN